MQMTASDLLCVLCALLRPLRPEIQTHPCDTDCSKRESAHRLRRLFRTTSSTETAVVTESEYTDPPSRIAHLFTDEEGEELAGLMLSFDGGMIDFGELDGFLSALAVAPQPSTLDRWWTTLFGPEPEWETEADPLRARALVERYYGYVQARVALSPFELGPDAVPPLWSMTEPFDEDEDDVDLLDLDADDGDDPLLLEDEDADPVGPSIEAGTVDFDRLSEADVDDAELDDDDLDDDDIGDIATDDDEFAEGDDEFADDGFDGIFAVGETWLSGFRYAISLQSDDWRRVVEEEPGLARWLNALWEAADAAQDGESGPLDSLPGMAPTAAAPEDAGFLALESTLREHSRDADSVPDMDEGHLVGLIPALLHQLWRRHREGVGPVVEALEADIATGMANRQFAIADELDQLLEQHAVPAGGMKLEYLDGFWTAQRAAAVEVSPFDSLVRILGEDKVWDDAEDAREVMTALIGYWNAIGERLARKADPEDQLCYPFIDLPLDRDPSEEPDRPYGRNFAKGFLAAIEEFPRSAKLLLMDPEAKHWLAPIEALAGGHSLEKRSAKLGFEERMALIAELPECIAELSGFWTASGGAGPREPVHREPLPGRNDPCPCGSGKKYKKCHGAPERLN